MEKAVYLTGPSELQAQCLYFKSFHDWVEEYISIIRFCVKMEPAVLDLTEVLLLMYVSVPVFSN